MRILAAFVAAGVSALGGMAVAQTPITQDRPIARASATEVLLDVAVADKHGKPVRNLKRGDIEIYEDDVRQPITSFRFIPAAEAQQHNGRAAATTPLPAASRPLRAVNLVCLVFHNLDPVARGRAIDVARAFLKNEFPPETYIGMFVLDDRLTPVYPFTKNRQELAQAVDQAFTLRPLDFLQASEAALTANPTQLTIDTVVDNVNHSATTTYRVFGGEVSPTVIAGAEVSTGTNASVMRGARITEARDFSDITGMRETDRIINMITQFGRLPGRKLVLLLSTGFKTTGDPDRFQSIVSKANDAHITVDAFDVSGLSEHSTAQAGDLALGQVATVSRTQTAVGGSLSAAKEKSRQGDTMNDAVRNSDVQASLRALAEDTGGFLVANTNEFRKPLQRIVDDLETHYELSYRPTSERYDGRLRTIKVKLAQSDWRVESRTGYFAVPSLHDSSPLLPHEIIGLALLDSKPLPRAFPLQSGVFQFRSEGENRQAALVIEIPGGVLAAAPNPARHSLVLHHQLLALIKDSTGQIVDQFSLDAPYEVQDEKAAELRTTPLVYTHPLDLPPGRYTAQTIVMDRQGGRSSSSLVPFETAASASGLALSSALLIRRIEPAPAGSAAAAPLMFGGRRLVPFVDTTLAPETKPYAYFVVYPNRANAAKPKAQVEFTVDGVSVADQTVDLPAPDTNGEIPMVIRAAVHTGRCELKITAMQGSETASRTLSYTIAAK